MSDSNKTKNFGQHTRYCATDTTPESRNYYSIQQKHHENLQRKLGSYVRNNEVNVALQKY